MVDLGPGKGPGSLLEHILQLITSPNNSIQQHIKEPRRTHISDELLARALNKDTWHVTIPNSLESLESLDHKNLTF